MPIPIIIPTEWQKTGSCTRPPAKRQKWNVRISCLPVRQTKRTSNRWEPSVRPQTRSPNINSPMYQALPISDRNTTSTSQTTKSPGQVKSSIVSWRSIRPFLHLLSAIRTPFGRLQTLTSTTISSCSKKPTTLKSQSPTMPWLTLPQELSPSMENPVPTSPRDSIRSW